MPSFRAIVSGRVQGVGFRFFAQRVASELGLSGYARNLPDGNVEVVAAGDKPLLDSFLRKLEEGPSSSHVENVDTEWHGEEQRFNDFSIRY